MIDLGRITAIPEHQLSDELEHGDHFHANGLESRVLYILEERIKGLEDREPPETPK